MAKKQQKVPIIKEVVMADFPHKYQEEIVIPHDLIPKRYWTWEYQHGKDMQWITIDGVKVRLKFIATNGDGYQGFEHIIQRAYGHSAEIISTFYRKKYNIMGAWHYVKMEKI